MAESASWNPTSWFPAESKRNSSPLKVWHEALRKSFVYQPLKALQHSCTQEATRLVHYIQQHPVQTAIGSCLIAAIAFRKHIKAIEQRLQQHDAWSVWRRDVSVAQKKNQYDAAFAQELLHTIQVRYMKLASIEDFMGPIQQFMHDNAAELQDMQSYVRTARWLQSIGLQRCVDMKLYHEANERIERLELLKVVCLHWLSKTKLELACA